MGLFKKKPDPFSERTRALNDEIGALEAKIKKLNAKLEKNPPQPKWRSTTLPSGQVLPPPPPAAREPVFEEIGQIKTETPASTPDHYNELGVRKYDLAALWRRLKNHFHGPPVNNPKLVSYLAAGSIQGLRPLRYEKRIARNRFLAVLAVAILVLTGLVFFLFNRK